MPPTDFPELLLLPMRPILQPSLSSSSRTLAQRHCLLYVPSLLVHTTISDSCQCAPLLEIALQAAKSCGIPKERVYILEMPKEFSGDKKLPFKTVSQLILAGEKLPQLEALKWEKGQGARQTAYLCYSSGTSGLPVGQLTCYVISMHRARAN